MKWYVSRIAVGTAFAVLLALSAQHALGATTTYKIDPRHSSAEFAVTHLMIATVRGEFHAVNGTVVFDDYAPSKSSVDVTIDASTVDTRDPDRDKHLRSADFFDVANHPNITFVSTRVEPADPGKLRITGALTIRGITKPVVLTVSVPKPAIKDPWGMQRTAASASTKINRQDFGVAWNKTLDSGGVVVGDDVDIDLDVEMFVPPPGK
jgi:polyisoprenoid-binding protein YceI